MSPGKGIAGLTSDTPTALAGKLALKSRFETLRHALQTALGEVDEQRENVHQLRVACRRAEAAVWMFRPCLTIPEAKKARRKIKLLRRIAGTARDADVVLVELMEQLSSVPPSEAPGIELLLGMRLTERMNAQVILEDVGPTWLRSFEDWRSDFVDQLQSPSHRFTRLSDLCGERIWPLFLNLWEHLCQPDPDWKELHQIRINLKRLRYSLEIIAKVVSEDTARAVAPEIESLQSILGSGHDHDIQLRWLETLAQRLPQLACPVWSRWSALIGRLRDQHRDGLKQRYAEFLAWRQTTKASDFPEAVRRMLSLPPEAIPEK